MAQNGATDPNTANEQAGAPEFAKGKGKAVEEHEDTSMVEDDDEEEEDEEVEEETVEEDGMEEIDLDNVIGRRTRGKVIDFAKAAQENPPDEDEDEEEDEDFELEDETMQDA
ncbi:histone chaperone domain CHZ-domain-containing protein [Cladorrhinum samala]|uniref:Histone chaperone domain CHZ-domain-containing protein n=1 Tax=Cladorrhinum samala TaxID=585594 RepID=A0AAV9HKQ0_9PEZI|nr:histone chaperone domain CHZ-domain-containing protein [Cladorrhinum samala]